MNQETETGLTPFGEWLKDLFVGTTCVDFKDEEKAEASKAMSSTYHLMFGSDIDNYDRLLTSGLTKTQAVNMLIHLHYDRAAVLSRALAKDEGRKVRWWRVLRAVRTAFTRERDVALDRAIMFVEAPSVLPKPLDVVARMVFHHDQEKSTWTPVGQDNQKSEPKVKKAKLLSKGKKGGRWSKGKR